VEVTPVLTEMAVSPADETRPGESAANARDREERERREQRRIRNREEWIVLYQHQRRLHLAMALDARRKARKLREAA
jgi:hypothetical protein